MKFKLKKSEHLNKFQLVSRLSKSGVSTHENKSINSDSLVFYHTDEKLYLYTSNNVSSILIFLCDMPIEFKNFALETKLFTQAFGNFPTDDVQFAFVEEENQLVFGNKKTRVALKTSLANDIDDRLSNEFSIDKKLEFNKLDTKDLHNAFKFTSFSCAPDFDEYPYTSIMFSIEDDKFNAQSSDKHRISVFGKKYELQQSYLFSKTISDVILYYIEKIPGIIFSLYNSKIYLTWDGGELSCSLEKNTYEKIFSNFNQFFSDQFFLTLELQKDSLVKSVKFVSSIENSHMISLTLDINKLVISANSNEKNAVVDTIEIENYEVLSVSYVSSHLIRVLDLLDSKKLKLNFIKHNDFILLMLEAENFKHILFPMD